MEPEEQEQLIEQARLNGGNSLRAQLDLADYYTNLAPNSDNIETRKLGLKYYQMAAAQNSPLALFAVGNWYMFEEQDKSTALSYYKKAADLDHPESQFQTALLFEEGVDLKDITSEKSSAEYSLEYLQNAANNNHRLALMKLAGRYLSGDPLIEKNLEQSTEYYKKAADLNYIRAQYEMALIYMQGRGVKQNYNEALKWLKLCETNPVKPYMKDKTLEAIKDATHEVELKIALDTCKQRFIKVVEQVDGIRSRIILERRDEADLNKSAELGKLKKDLVDLGKSLFDNPNYASLGKNGKPGHLTAKLSTSDIYFFSLACIERLDKTQDILMVHRNPIYEELFLPLIKGLAGVIASIIVFPGLIASSNFKKDYKETFFSTSKPQSAREFKVAMEEIHKELNDIKEKLEPIVKKP